MVWQGWGRGIDDKEEASNVCQSKRKRKDFTRLGKKSPRKRSESGDAGMVMRDAGNAGCAALGTSYGLQVAISMVRS